MPKANFIQLLLTEDEAQELSILLGREKRRGKLEAELVDLRDELTKKRVEAGWLAPSEES